jgi:hypothetical protein
MSAIFLKYRSVLKLSLLKGTFTSTRKDADGARIFKKCNGDCCCNYRLTYISILNNLYRVVEYVIHDQISFYFTSKLGINIIINQNQL